VKRVEFVSDRLSYTVLRGRWCNIIVVNVHAPSEEKSDESKDSFYEELEQVFDHFPKYHTKILLNSTMFPHRNIHQYTWTSPDGKTLNQIGHILIDRRWHSSVLDVRSFRGAGCDTDHYLVVPKVRERLAVANRPHRGLIGKDLT